MPMRRYQEIPLDDELVSEETALAQLEEGYPGAEETLADPDRLSRLLDELEEKLKTVPNVGDKLAMLPVMISMVRSYLKKEYDKTPVGTMVAIVSALAYFLSPVDLIPDRIPGLGFIDDAAVISACLALCSADIREYEVWREQQSL